MTNVEKKRIKKIMLSSIIALITGMIFSLLLEYSDGGKEVHSELGTFVNENWQESAIESLGVAIMIAAALITHKK